MSQSNVIQGECQGCLGFRWHDKTMPFECEHCGSHSWRSNESIRREYDRDFRKQLPRMVIQAKIAELQEQLTKL